MTVRSFFSLFRWYFLFTMLRFLSSLPLSSFFLRFIFLDFYARWQALSNHVMNGDRQFCFRSLRFNALYFIIFILVVVVVACVSGTSALTCCMYVVLCTFGTTSTRLEQMMVLYFSLRSRCYFCFCSQFWLFLVFSRKPHAHKLLSR